MRRTGALGSVWRTLAVLAGAAVVVLAVSPLREAVADALHGDVHRLRVDLRGAGLAGVLILFALIQIHAVVLFPSEVINATAGLVYGFAVAFPLLMAFWLVSLLLAYWLGAHAGRAVAVRLAGDTRVATAERMLERGGATTLLIVRLIPLIPYSPVGYAAGAAKVPLWRYTWTSFVGVLPVTVAVTYIGHSLGTPSLTDPLLWAALAVLVALAGVTIVAARRLRRMPG
jgi:uncharacterized membrane protein YdjX (TVP38/TMEM64 family)